MRRWERWTFNLSSLAVAGSGFAYLWMKYLLETDDPFALVNHPWQATMLHLHVLTSPSVILILGVVLNSHIMKKLKTYGRPNRTSGLLTLVTFGVMIGSGYLLQVTTSALWLKGLIALHVASAVLFTAAYGTHLVLSATLARRRPAAAPVHGVA